VGESGSGKSTLARAALRLLEASSGRVVWLGRELASLPARELRGLRRDLQIIFQDPLGSLNPRMTVAEIVAEPLRVHERSLDASARDAAVTAVLARVGLSSALAQRYPHELSGGQCQRVGIARAMVLGPRLLVCDEPVSALDAPTQQQIVALLAELRETSGLSLLFISHNLALVRQLCERVLVLYLGRMMELAPTAALFAEPRHPYSRELLAAIPGVTFVEMRGADICCGSAGVYNVVQNEMSMQILEHKMESVNATGARIIATANPGCMLQLQAGVRMHGSGQRVMHVVEVLDLAYRNA